MSLHVLVFAQHSLRINILTCSNALTCLHVSFFEIVVTYCVNKFWCVCLSTPITSFNPDNLCGDADFTILSKTKQNSWICLFYTSFVRREILLFKYLKKYWNLEFACGPSYKYYFEYLLELFAPSNSNNNENIIRLLKIFVKNLWRPTSISSFQTYSFGSNPWIFKALFPGLWWGHYSLGLLVQKIIVKQAEIFRLIALVIRIR